MDNLEIDRKDTLLEVQSEMGDAGLISLNKKVDYLITPTNNPHSNRSLGTKQAHLEWLQNRAIDVGKTNNHELSIKYCQQALAYPEIRAEKNLPILLSIIRTYRLGLKNLNRYKEMAFWSDSLYFYTEKYRHIENTAKINELAIRYAAQKKERQKNVLKYEAELTERRYLFYITIGILSLAGLGGLGILFRKLAFKNNHLEKALGEIQRLNKAKDFFMGIIAHDLRRPLSTLHEMAELADYYIQTHRYESLQKISAHIDQSGAKVRHLLDNMINWALSQEGRYEPQSIPVVPKIDNVLELYSQDILKKQIQLFYNCQPTLTAYVDGNAFELIIRNLIDNALKNLPANGMLTIEGSETSLGEIQIRITDNGRGISPEKVEEVKYILAHADEIVPGQIGRTLGMLITGRFVKINKGTIRIESRINQGTTFLLTFPGTAHC